MAKVNEAFYAISWAHDLSGVKNPCHSSVVSSVKEGAHRSPYLKKNQFLRELYRR